MHHRGGGTFIAADSVPVVARYLAEHPEGVLPDDFDFEALTRQCHDFIELTGDAGDVVLMHPYMLHATSQNVIQHGRLITNPPITLREPMRFDRDDPASSPRSSGPSCTGWALTGSTSSATGERELVVPERVLEQQRREAAETERLAASRIAAGQ